MRLTLNHLHIQVMMPENFEDFYCYAFRYCLTGKLLFEPSWFRTSFNVYVALILIKPIHLSFSEDKQKCVDIESSCLLIDLVLGSQFRAQVDSFSEFLKVGTHLHVLNIF